MNQTPQNKVSIIVIGNNENTTYLIKENLETPYTEIQTSDWEELDEKLKLKAYDLCIADLSETQAETHLMEQLRNNKELLVIYLIRNTLTDAMTDQYHLIMPFSFKELQQKVEYLLRDKHKLNSLNTKYDSSIGRVRLSARSRALYIGDKAYKLSQREAELLQVLLEHKNEYVERAAILLKLWGYNNFLTAKSMDVLITRIRKMIKDEPDVIIENQYGVGYRIRLID